MAVSHPLAALPSQFAKPVLHEPTVHAPALHPAVALASEHVLPQRPQLRGSVPVAVSHPSEASPSQLAKPVLQVIVHAPEAHAAVPLVRLHATRHPPQFDTSVLRLTSQPFDAVESQSPKPVLHDATVHALATHAPVALTGAHVRPHAPQFSALVLVSTHMPLQVVTGVGPQTD